MKNPLKILALTIALTLVLFPATPTLAADPSDPPGVNHIMVTNNAGMPDTVKVVNLQPGDIVKVFTADLSGKLGQATAISRSVSIKIPQIGESDGIIQVTVTSRGKTESSPTEVSFVAEPQSNTPAPGDIIITNNAGRSDTVKVVNLLSGDIVKVYDKDISQILGQAKVATGSSSTIIKIAQLSTNAGTIKVTVTSKGMRESVPTDEIPYAAEVSSSAPDAANITVVNNAGQPDTVTVAGLSSGAVVKVYPDNISAIPLGKATVPTGAPSITIRINQLGTLAGSVFVSVANPGQAESGRTDKAYEAEAQSTAPTQDTITINNYAGASDTITVTGAEGDRIKVYSDVGLNTLLGQATIAKGATSATVTVTQLGAAGGDVWVTISSTGKAESDSTQKGFDPEAKSTAPDAGVITIVNNAGSTDTVTVEGAEGDVINVYSDLGLNGLLGQATVAKGATTAKVSIAQLGKAAGTVYITLSSPGKAQSDQTSKNYDAEPQSVAPDAANITIVNNAGTLDTVKVTGAEGELVKVYANVGLSTLLGQATIAKGATSATISIRQLPESGVVYVTITSTGKCESNGTLKAFSEEIDSPAPAADDVTVTNNAGLPDTVKVNYLDPGDTVKVYATTTATRVWGQATVAKDADSVTINFGQLGGAGGTIYVSLSKSGMLESDRTAKVFAAETKSLALDAANITVVNNAGIASQVTVSNLQSGDIVSVYEDAKLATLLGQATVAKDATTAQVSVQGLSSSGGSIYVTVTGTGLLESDATEKSFGAQTESALLDPDSILIINNTGADLVIVYGLDPGDMVKVYQDADSTKVIGSATVASKQSQVIITISQLGADGGSVFLTYSAFGKLEGDRVEKTFAAE
ncbi:MAG: hypothetical protein ABRQ26_00130 [Syntrophomonadaceae bacterium]